jgi:hypothetical protein
VPATPNITLTATLDDILGAAAGSTANPAKLRIALCGYGPVLPRIAGTAMLARIGPFDLQAASSSPISTPLWGNDQITPAGTYYTIEVLDGLGNIVQAGAYQFTGAGTIDLSNAAQILPGQPAGIPELDYLPCTGTVPGTAYTAPGTVVMVFYNGVALPAGQAFPILSYTLTGGTAITLNFTTDVGDQIYALCIVP